MASFRTYVPELLTTSREEGERNPQNLEGGALTMLDIQGLPQLA